MRGGAGEVGRERGVGGRLGEGRCVAHQVKPCVVLRGVCGGRRKNKPTPISYGSVPIAEGDGGGERGEDGGKGEGVVLLVLGLLGGLAGRLAVPGLYGVLHQSERSVVLVGRRNRQR